jgi:hypothetical protein
MELFFFLLGLLLLAFPIIAVVALVKSIGLGERLFRADSRQSSAQLSDRHRARCRQGRQRQRDLRRRLLLPSRNLSPTPEPDQA